MCVHLHFISVAWQKQVGDITYLTDKFLFLEDPKDPFFELPAEQRSKRAAIKFRSRLWTNGVVPYIISNDYNGNSLHNIIEREINFHISLYRERN